MQDMTIIALGVDPEIVKAAGAADATDEAKTALKTDVLKALGLDEDTIKTTITDAAKSAAEQATEGFGERLKTVEKMAQPGGPVKARTEAEAQIATKADALRSEAHYLRSTAATITDPELALAYRTKAAQADSEALQLEKVG